LDLQFFIYTTFILIVGILFGSLLSYIVIRFTFTKRAREFDRFLKSFLSFQKSKKEKEKKKESSLILLDKKFKELNSELTKIRTAEYNNYIKNLNHLLKSMGIKNIKEK